MPVAPDFEMCLSTESWRHLENRPWGEEDTEKPLSFLGNITDTEVSKEQPPAAFQYNWVSHKKKMKNILELLQCINFKGG